MDKYNSTAERLLLASKEYFWNFGFSNVSLRQIANEAGVDVALVKRYFGSKRGLFEASVTEKDFEDLIPENVEDLKAVLLELFQSPVSTPSTPSFFTMLIMNAQDAEVGEFVRQNYRETIEARMVAALGSSAKAALVTSAVLGFSIVEKMLRSKGIAERGSKKHRAQLEALLDAAINLGNN